MQAAGRAGAAARAVGAQVRGGDLLAAQGERPRGGRLRYGACCRREQDRRALRRGGSWSSTQGRCCVLCAFAFLAGGLDAVVGGGGLVQLPALLVVLPRHAGRGAAGHEQAASIVGPHRPPCTTPHGHGRPPAGRRDGGRRLRRLRARRAARHAAPTAALLRPVVLVALVAVLAYTLRRPALGEVEALRLTPRRAAHGRRRRRRRHRPLRRLRRPGHRQLPGVPARRRRRPVVPARQRHLQGRQHRHQPRGAAAVRRRRPRAVGPRRRDGGEQPGRQPGRRAARRAPRQRLGAPGLPRRGVGALVLRLAYDLLPGV